MHTAQREASKGWLAVARTEQDVLVDHGSGEQSRETRKRASSYSLTVLAGQSTMAALRPPAPAQPSAERSKPVEQAKKAKPARAEPVRDFIDSICGEGSTKPSGRSLSGKHG